MGVQYRDDQAGYALETSKAKQVVPCERQRGADEEVEDASPPPACDLLGGSGGRPFIQKNTGEVFFARRCQQERIQLVFLRRKVCFNCCSGRITYESIQNNN